MRQYTRRILLSLPHDRFLKTQIYYKNICSQDLFLVFSRSTTFLLEGAAPYFINVKTLSVAISWVPVPDSSRDWNLSQIDQLASQFCVPEPLKKKYKVWARIGFSFVNSVQKSQAHMGSMIQLLPAASWKVNIIFIIPYTSSLHISHNSQPLFPKFSYSWEKGDDSQKNYSLI